MATDGRFDDFTSKQKHSQVGQLFRIKSRGQQEECVFQCVCAERWRSPGWEERDSGSEKEGGKRKPVRFCSLRNTLQLPLRELSSQQIQSKKKTFIQRMKHQQMTGQHLKDEDWGDDKLNIYHTNWQTTLWFTAIKDFFF